MAAFRLGELWTIHLLGLDRLGKTYQPSPSAAFASGIGPLHREFRVQYGPLSGQTIRFAVLYPRLSIDPSLSNCLLDHGNNSRRLVRSDQLPRTVHVRSGPEGLDIDDSGSLPQHTAHLSRSDHLEHHRRSDRIDFAYPNAMATAYWDPAQTGFGRSIRGWVLVSSEQKLARDDAEGKQRNHSVRPTLSIRCRSR